MKINICGMGYTVKRVPRTHPELEPDGLDGACSFAQCIIYIADDVKGDAFKDVLLHEIQHAVYFCSGAQNVLENEFADKTKIDPVMEAVIRIMTPWLLQVLRQTKGQLP